MIPLIPDVNKVLTNCGPLSAPGGAFFVPQNFSAHLDPHALLAILQAALYIIIIILLIFLYFSILSTNYASTLTAEGNNAVSSTATIAIPYLIIVFFVVVDSYVTNPAPIFVPYFPPG